MIKLFLILFILKSVICVSDDDSYEKYIDLLPEKEKQEFLDRIARRLLDEIKTDNVPNQSHVEVNDDQLETHDSLVQNIMKEETDKLKDEKIQENLDKKNDKLDTNGEERHIDLTLREGKRLKRKNSVPDERIETTSEFDYSVVPVKTIYDDANVVIEKDKNISISKEDKSIPISKEDPDKKSLVEAETNIPDLQFNNSSQQQPGITENDVNEIMKLNKAVKENINLSSEANINDTKINVMTEATDNNFNDTIKPNEDMDSSTIQTENVTTTENIENAIGPLNGTNDDFTKESNDNQTQTSESSLKSSSIPDPVKPRINLLRQDSAEIAETSLPNIPKKDTESVKLEEMYGRSSTNKNVVVKTVRKSKQLTQIRSKNKGFVSKENSHESKTSLRLGLDGHKSKKIFKNHSKLMEYEVYEVAAEKPPFSLRKEIKVNEQPNYVPVYNYAPENAYFRPYDRYGPDNDNINHKTIENHEYIDTEPDLEIDTNIKLNVPNVRSRFVGYNKKQDRSFLDNNNNFNTVKRVQSNLYGFMKPVHKKYAHHNNYYNPNDYLDMDYAYNIRNMLRKNIKHFPNSDEADHPYNNIHKSDTVKDHLRAVRNLLYLQNRFGYVPSNRDKVRKFNKSKNPTLPDKHVRLLKEPTSDNIAIDYYFGRLNSNEDLNENGLDLESENKLEVKDVITDTNNFHTFFNTMLQVLEDMVRFDNGGLEKYSWLTTTVDIQTALHKLYDLSEDLIHSEDVHPKDVELIKYSLYLFNSSKSEIDANHVDQKTNFRAKSMKKKTKFNKKHKGLLPQNKNRGKIYQPLKLWRDFATFIRKEKEEVYIAKWSVLYEFEYLLQDLLFYLNEFHDAITHIASITSYDDQQWFKDLKQIYFNGANKNQLAKVILHLGLVNLLENIEGDAVIGAENNYENFIKRNVRAVKRTKDNFVFVLRVLDELNGL